MNPARHIVILVSLVLSTVRPTFADAEAPAATRPAMTGESAELRRAVTQFVTSEFVHGVPFEGARALGPSATPILRELLATESMTNYRPNIVVTIAYIGRPEAFGILHAFIWDTFQGEVEGETYRALAVAQSLLGFVRSPEVVPYLQKGVDPGYWSKIPWTYESNRGEALSLLMSKLTINGLSYTGDPKAGETLRHLETKPFHPRQLPNVREGLSRHAEIASRGLEVYMRSK